MKFIKVNQFMLIATEQVKYAISGTFWSSAAYEFINMRFMKIK